MLRFIHSSDWHLTAGKYFDETLRCLEFIADVAGREKVDAELYPGDFSHSDLPHRVMVPAERNAIAAHLVPIRVGGVGLAKHVTYGNHDIGGDLDLFGALSTVYVHASAKLQHCAGYDLLTVPYPHKRHWLAQRGAGAVDQQRQELGHTLGQALRGLVQQRRPGIPLIGLAHLNIAGSKLGGGEVLIGQEIELSAADLDEIGCDYWALGHIHNPQQMAEKAWYCGTPQPHSFGDSNVNGCNLVEIEGPGKPPRVTFIETPATKLLTDEVVWIAIGGAAGDWVHRNGCPLESVRRPGEQLANVVDCHLRVVAQVDEADRECVDWQRLEGWGKAFEPKSLRIERRIIPQTRVRSERIREARTVCEKLEAYFATLTPPPPDPDTAGALEALEELAT